jgi:hypothetical protein
MGLRLRTKDPMYSPLYWLACDIYIHNITPVSLWSWQRSLPSTCFDPYTRLSLLTLLSNSSYSLAGLGYFWHGPSLKLPQVSHRMFTYVFPALPPNLINLFCQSPVIHPFYMTKPSQHLAWDKLREINGIHHRRCRALIVQAYRRFDLDGAMQNIQGSLSSVYQCSHC